MGVKFFCRSLMHPVSSGTLFESSRYLARGVAGEVRGKNIAELGAGTGKISREILSGLEEDARLTCFEIDPEFSRILKQIRDPRLEVVNDDALNLWDYSDSYDCIVSGIPFTLMNRQRRSAMMRLLSDYPRYIHFQYNPFLRKTFENYFRDVKVKREWRNLPLPAFIYVCSNTKK